MSTSWSKGKWTKTFWVPMGTISKNGNCRAAWKHMVWRCGTSLRVRAGTMVTSWLGRQLPQCCWSWQGSHVTPWVTCLPWGCVGHIWCRTYTPSPFCPPKKLVVFSSSAYIVIKNSMCFWETLSRIFQFCVHLYTTALDLLIWVSHCSAFCHTKMPLNCWPMQKSYRLRSCCNYQLLNILTCEVRVTKNWLYPCI